MPFDNDSEFVVTVRQAAWTEMLYVYDIDYPAEICRIPWPLAKVTQHQEHAKRFSFDTIDTFCQYGAIRTTDTYYILEVTPRDQFLAQLRGRLDMKSLQRYVYNYGEGKYHAV